MKRILARCATAVVLGLLVIPVAPAVAARVPGTSCSVFPANNVWRMDIRKLPVHGKSATWKRATHAGSTRLHPDFGPPSYGIPFDVVPSSHAKVSIAFRYDDESDRGPYPFGGDVRIEGGSDRHAIMIDEGTCVLYELFAVRRHGGHPTAGSGAIFDLDRNTLRPTGWTSADAAGLPIFPGLVRYDEVFGPDAGIHHALRFTVGCTRRGFVWPARHQAGVADPTCPPMGARFRLTARYDISSYSPRAQIVLRAMKRYGMIVADNGSEWYFQGAVDPRWTYGFVDQLKRVPASAVVAVDSSACKAAANSGAFAYGPGCPTP
ncbi:MAG: hypothetical protein ACRDG8_01975 [Actinomycetota bacterium]